MLDIQEIEAAIMELMEEVDREPEDAHEIYERLQQILASMRATGMPVPDDLLQMEKDLSAEFAGDAASARRTDDPC